MISIEKLKSSLPQPQIGLVDLLHKDNTKGKNMLGIYVSTHLLKSYVEQELKDISIGSIYGIDGIDINILLLDKPNIVVETTFKDLKLLPYTKQVRLLKEHVIILTDFEEGGSFYGHMDECLISYLTKLNIIPKKIISITSGFNQTSYTDLNIHCVYIPIWPIFTALSNEFYIKMVFDENFRKEQQASLINTNKKFGIYPNKKPRLHRVNLLAELENRNILNKFDWSLVYSKEPLGTENDYGDFLKSPNNFRFNDLIEEYTNDKIEKFLSSYEFPRVFVDSKHKTFGDSIGPAESWFGKYNYYISAETYVHPNEISFGTLGFLTEKTFKSLCIGSHPFILGVPGSEEQLRKIGFKLIDYGYDQLRGNERITAICDVIERLVSTQIEKDTVEDRIYNFELITSPTFLARLITNPLNSFFSLRTQQS